MKVYLAGSYSRPYTSNRPERFQILESFYYVHDWMTPYIENHWDFLLDSGAFTFFGKGGDVDWWEYVDRYCDYIIKHDIDLFFELDVEKVSSMELVENIRDHIEQRTGKKPIPVWRPMRGIEYWHKMIEEYPYIAISASGKYDSAWTRREESLPVLKKMISTAQKEDVKVHGLGYTSLSNLKFLGWDSIDSTAWLYGNRGGYLCHFNGHTIVKTHSPEGSRIINQQTAINNFNEWVKFQRYAESNL